MLIRHISFLKSVAYYALTAFGGPQGHIGMMVKTFVNKRHDVTEEELLEYNTFCQMLPGPSSTQTVMLIALKRGGIPLALVTLCLWILPAFLIMAAFSFLISFIDTKSIETNAFKFVQPMSIGFIIYAAMRLMKVNIKHFATWCIMIGSTLTIVFFRSPWAFPIVLIAAGCISNVSNKRIPAKKEKPKSIKWLNLWLFALLFIVAGVLSEVARTHNWTHGRAFNLFENFYRFGAIVFGGGQALLPMMLYQFVTRPMLNGRSAWMSSESLLTGYGIVQAVPGPVFSICTFAGGLALSSWGWEWQIAGCFIATIAVFVPSTLMLFFFFPIYHNLKQHVIIYRALEGINAAVVGIIWASAIILMQTLFTPTFDLTNVIVIIITFCILNFTKIPAPFIVLGWLLLGWTLQ